MLILKKNIDHSLLTAGITLPIDTFEIFWQHIGKELHRGESMNINIIIDNITYDCKLYNVDFNKEQYPNHKDVLQLRYSPTSPIAMKLQSIFSNSYKYFKQQKTFSENKYKPIRLPAGVNEYIIMTTTNINRTFIVDYYTDYDNQTMQKVITDIDEYLFENDNFELKTDPTASYVEIEKIQRVRRLNKTITQELKQLYDYRCQITGERIGNQFGCSVVEAHHIEYFTKSLNNDTSNIIIVNPSFHRIIHQASPIFDRQTLSFVFPNGVVEKVKLDKHLNCK